VDQHIVVDTLGNLLAVVVHAANIHDTKSGIEPARLAFENYPSLKKFCADAGYRKTFVWDVDEILGVDISEKIKPHEWENFPGAGWLNAPSVGSTIPVDSAKITRSPSLPLKLSFKSLIYTL
jgi:hypothetical protein